MTVAELRALLAGLDDGLEVFADEEGRCIRVATGEEWNSVNIERLRPGESIAAMYERERLAAEEGARRTAEFMTRLGLPGGESPTDKEAT